MTTNILGMSNTSLPTSQATPWTSSMRSERTPIKVFKGSINKICGGSKEIQEKIFKELLNLCTENPSIIEEAVLYLLQRSLSVDERKYISTYVDLLLHLKIDSKVISSSVDKLTEQTKQLGELLYYLRKGNLISNIQLESASTEALLGFLVIEKDFEEIVDLSKLVDIVKKRELKKEQMTHLSFALEKPRVVVEPKIEDRLKLRSNREWKLYIQQKSSAPDSYKIEEDSVHILEHLISNIYLKDIFRAKGDITAFSLFQKGGPEWNDHMGGGRFIIKTTEWETKYDEFFTWLQTLGSSTETYTLLNFICGIRFKIVRVQGMFTVEVWFSSVNKQKKELEDKLKCIFKDSVIKTDYFEEEPKSKGKQKTEKMHPEKHSTHEKNITHGKYSRHETVNSSNLSKKNRFDALR